MLVEDQSRSPMGPSRCRTKANKTKNQTKPTHKKDHQRHGDMDPVSIVEEIMTYATVWACSTPLNAPRCGRRHILAVSWRSVVIISLKINIV